MTETAPFAVAETIRLRHELDMRAAEIKRLQASRIEIRELIRKVSSEPHLWSTLAILEDLETILGPQP